MRGLMVCLGLALFTVGLLFTLEAWITSGPAGWTPDGSAVLVFVGWIIATIASLWEPETIAEGHPDQFGSLDMKERGL